MKRRIERKKWVCEREREGGGRVRSGKQARKQRRQRNWQATFECCLTIQKKTKVKLWYSFLAFVWELSFRLNTHTKMCCVSNVKLLCKNYFTEWSELGFDCQKNDNTTTIQVIPHCVSHWIEGKTFNWKFICLVVCLLVGVQLHQQ